MAAITINDLHINRALDLKAMSSIKGGMTGGWVFGWIRPFVDAAPSFGSNAPVNFYQTNNFYIADQMNNQISVIDVKNSAANATINVNAMQNASNSLKLA
jgi:YVTN family beta-propeller protein